ncbi:MAG: preprotein translocase subunit SecG [Bacteroidetes bacterium]|nr:preprotein translocase subunit SecG [Bacteroidota bacterium]MBS1975597.1 preprotein translocase subunit SecG [Bacteroidota bacterium]
MALFFVILIVLASIFLSFVILVQNPKGGGLAGNVGGFSNQFMGVKQTTDVLEKSTWVLAITIALLSLFSAFFVHSSSAVQVRDTKVNATSVPSAPANNQPSPLTLPK